MTYHPSRTAALFAALLVGLSATSVSACPACKDTIAGGDTSATDTNGSAGTTAGELGLPSGFNTSVYFMLAAFVGTVGLVGATIVKGARGTAVAGDAGEQA
jgi:hypothetical protein